MSNVRCWGGRFDWYGSNSSVTRLLINTDAAKSASHSFISVGQIGSIDTIGVTGGTVTLSFQNCNWTPTTSNNVWGLNHVNTDLNLYNQEFPYYATNTVPPIFTTLQQGALVMDFVGSSGNTTLWGGPTASPTAPPQTIQQAINRLATAVSGIIGPHI
jgi:hypothetical protein